MNAVDTDIELTTDLGLVMRCWRMSDAQDVVRAFAASDMMTQTSSPITTTSDAEWWIADRVAAWQSTDTYTWAVVDGAEVVGSISASAIDRNHGLAWVSYWTTVSARGRGVSSSALRCLADWAFEDLNLFRLELGHRVNNPASCAVAVAAGFIPEGIERAKLRYGHERFDVETHARLATDAMGQ